MYQEIKQTASVRKDFRITRGGNFLPRVNEFYLRRDIPCGYENCILCPIKSDFFIFDMENQEANISQQLKKNFILVVDLPGLSQSLDCLFSSDLFPNMVLAHSLIDWIKRHSRSGFKKLKTFLELDNHGQMRVFPDRFSQDVNDVQVSYKHNQRDLFDKESFEALDAVVRLTGYFVEHFSFLEGVQVVLLSADARLEVIRQIQTDNSFLNTVKVVGLKEYIEQFVSETAKVDSLIDSMTPSIDQIITEFSNHPNLVVDPLRLENYMGNQQGSKIEEEGNPLDKLTPMKSPLDLKSEKSSIQREKNRLLNSQKQCAELSIRVNRGELFRGKLRITRNNIEQANVGCRILGKDVLVKGKANLGEALNGDFVAIEILPVSEWLSLKSENLLTGMEEAQEEDLPNQQELSVTMIDKNLLKVIKDSPDLIITGKVAGVLKRDLRNVVAEVHSKISETLCLTQPMDSRLPPIILRMSTGVDKYIGLKLVISIDHWLPGTEHPFGHLVKVIGKSLDPETEATAILLEHQVETRPFSKKVIECLPPDDWVIPAEEEAKRWNLRGESVCSVDPPGCRDIDDALHSKVLENGNWEMGVHIADVTYYVRPDSWIDREAMHRCTTVYLVDRRTDMLPKRLTEVLCSLREKVDRLAFSVIWEVDPTSMQVVNVRFGKSIIHSRAALTYEMAHDRITDKNDASEVTTSLRRLLAFSQALKARRTKQGALTLASTQLKFKLEGSGQEMTKPSDMSLYTLLPTNSMIEEFMLLANITVARKIVNSFPASGILRKHSSPKPEMIKQFSILLKSLGFDLNYTTNKKLAESLNSIKRAKDPMFNKLVRILTTRCMNEALYFCSADFDGSEYKHYGLATDIYTHFTSPIRRYADVTTLLYNYEPTLSFYCINKYLL